METYFKKAKDEIAKIAQEIVKSLIDNLTIRLHNMREKNDIRY